MKPLMNPVYAHLQSLADDQARHLPALHGQAASWHLWRKTEVNAITLALASRRPLLVCGEPGTGKSQLARAASVALGWHWQGVTLHARAEVQDLLYQFDAVRRLADAQHGAVNEDACYWQPQALWRALDWEGAKQYGSPRNAAANGKPQANATQDGAARPRGHVVLIDEIDKAPPDVPNGLLDVLGERCFEVPGLGIRVAAPAAAPDATSDTLAAADATAQSSGGYASDWPLIIITSNLERELPDAFVRRCVVLSHASVAEEGYNAFLLRYGRAHFATGRTGTPAMDEAILRACALQLQQDRQQAKLAQVYAPGLAEYLDLLYALHELAPLDTAGQWQWLHRLNQFAFLKSGHEPDALVPMRQDDSGERIIIAPGGPA